jgi:hypothetical protein
MLRRVILVNKTAAVRKNCRLPPATQKEGIGFLIPCTKWYQVSEESNFQELFQFVVSRDPHLLFRCTAFTVVFLLTLFKECAGNIFFQSAEKGHI